MEYDILPCNMDDEKGVRREGGFELYYLTPKQVLERFQRADKPLNRETVDVLFAPLVGTSWDRQIHEWLESEPFPFPAGMLGHVLLSNLYVNECFDRRILDEVALALQAFSLPDYPMRRFINTANVIERDELLFMEDRIDVVYADVTRKTPAFFHSIDQWRFYKNGQSLHTIVINTFVGAPSYFGYFDNKEYHYHEILSEGIIKSRFLLDEHYKIIPYIHPDQQAYLNGRQEIYVSPDFSFDPTWQQAT